MKVSELIEQLKGFDPDMPVIIQRDAEGNGYSHLSGADPDGIIVKFDDDEDGEYDVYDSNWTATEADMDDDEWAECLKLGRCVVLYPVD